MIRAVFGVWVHVCWVVADVLCRFVVPVELMSLSSFSPREPLGNLPDGSQGAVGMEGHFVNFTGTTAGCISARGTLLSVYQVQSED